MLDKNILLVNMQMDCSFATETMKKVQKALCINLTDDELDEWIYDGTFNWLKTVYRIATGTIVDDNLVLEMHHLDLIESIGFMTKQVFYEVYNDLEKLSKIDYFDMIAHNGAFIIHPNEFNGKGCTNLMLFQFTNN